MVGLGYTQAAADYARVYDLHVRIDHCERCGLAYGKEFAKEVAAAR